MDGAGLPVPLALSELDPDTNTLDFFLANPTPPPLHLLINTDMSKVFAQSPTLLKQWEKELHARRWKVAHVILGGFLPLLDLTLLVSGYDVHDWSDIESNLVSNSNDGNFIPLIRELMSYGSAKVRDQLHFHIA